MGTAGQAAREPWKGRPRSVPIMAEPRTATDKGRVEQVMLPTDEALHPDYPVAEAATRMRAAHLTAMPVVDGDEIVGFYTLTHLTQREDQPPTPASAEDARATRVADHMSAEIPFCYAHDDLATARQLLKEHHLSWLLVVNQDDEYVGLISAEAASGARPTTGLSPTPTGRTAQATGRAKMTAGSGRPMAYSVRPKLRR